MLKCMTAVEGADIIECSAFYTWHCIFAKRLYAEIFCKNVICNPSRNWVYIISGTKCGSSPSHYLSSHHLLETPLYQKKRLEFPTHSGVESPWGPNKVSFEDEAARWCSCVQRGPLSWASIFPRVTPIHGPGLLVRRHRAPNTRFCILLLLPLRWCGNWAWNPMSGQYAIRHIPAENSLYLNLGINIAKGTTDPRVEFCFPKWLL